MRFLENQLATCHFLFPLHGISDSKIKDTEEEYLELAVTAFDNLADKAITWIGFVESNGR
ncbi:MAG TPA: hypothetical protein VK581_13610 [Chthoniobacterales bacterium]|nr:hypothetical protein [Chthoniobacterales bacterium]